MLCLIWKILTIFNWIKRQVKKFSSLVNRDRFTIAYFLNNLYTITVAITKISEKEFIPWDSVLVYFYDIATKNLVLNTTKYL